MKKITGPENNMNSSDVQLAESIAEQYGWMMDSAGRIYDYDRVEVAGSLSELATAMRALNWFTAPGTRVTGVEWKKVPHEGTGCADAVRAHLR